jgi:hypothetical protein
MAPPLSLRYRGGCQPPKRAQNALLNIAFSTLQDTTILYNSLHTVNKEGRMIYNLLELMIWGHKSRTWKRWKYRRRLRFEQRRQFSEVAWLLYDWLDHMHGLNT